jgi:hypothetical protein
MFPPSYKLRTGESGGCGDFSDYDEMVAGYLINTKDKDNHAEGDDHDTESVTRVASEESITPRHTISDSNKAGGSPGGSIKSSRSWGIPSSLSSQKSIRFHEDKEDETAKVADDVMPSYESTKNSEGNTDSTGENRRSRGWGLLHTSVLLTHKSKDSTKSEKVKADKGGKPAKANKKNIRPPSYTDRILSHSLDEKRASLQCIGYNMCHQVLCSDHRPVSAVYSLEVNDNTKGALQSLSMNVELFEVLMQNFKIEYFHPVERSGKDKQSESSKSFSLDHEIKEIRIVLPLPTKDPLLQKKQDYGTHKIFGVRGAEDPIMTPLIECIHGVKGNIDHLFDLQVTIPWVPDTKFETPSELKSVYAAGDI